MTTGASVRINVDAGRLGRYAQAPDGPVMGYLVRIGNRVLTNAKRRVPVDTGYLRSTGTLTTDAARTTVRVAFRARYARFVHDGTRGRPGRPFLTDALREEVNRA